MIAPPDGRYESVSSDIEDSESAKNVNPFTAMVAQLREDFKVAQLAHLEVGCGDWLNNHRFVSLCDSGVSRPHKESNS